MSVEDLERFIDLLVAGDITRAEHQDLQSLLKTDAKARATFRQRMDLESGLRHWAVEAPESTHDEGGSIADDTLLHSALAVSTVLLRRGPSTSSVGLNDKTLSLLFWPLR